MMKRTLKGLRDLTHAVPGAAPLMQEPVGLCLQIGLLTD